MFLRLDINNILSSFQMIRPETELEKKLKDQNLPLEEYLQEEDAIQCFKDMKPNTKKYFNKDKIKQLIKYITEEPKEDDYQKGHKYPYISCMLLLSAPEKIQDMIVLPEEDFNEKYKNEIIENSEDIKKSEDDKKIKENKDDIKREEDDKTLNNEELKKDENKDNNIIEEQKEKTEENNKQERKEEKEEEKEEKIDEKNEDNKNIITTKTDEEKNIIEKESKLKLNNEEKREEQVKQKKLNIDKHSELLDLLLDFVIKKKSEFNDVLCGYFSSVFLSLSNKYPNEVFFYLYLIRQDALEQIVLNSYNKSLSSISLKILDIGQYYEGVEEIAKINPKYVDINFIRSKQNHLYEIRQKLLEKLITSIDLNGMKLQSGKYLDVYETKSIFFILCELIKKHEISVDIYLNENIAQHIFEILEEDIFNRIDIEPHKKTMYNYFLSLFTSIIYEPYAIDKRNGKYYPEFDYKMIFDTLKKKAPRSLLLEQRMFITFPKVLVTNFVENKTEKTLGMNNIYIMDLATEMFKYLKYKPTLFDFIVLETGFIDKSISFFFKYQLNNIYHNKFVNFFTLFLEESENHILLSDYIFNKKKFHTLLASFISQDLNIPNKGENNNTEYINRYEFGGGKKTLSCVHMHAVDLAYKIQAASGLKILEENDKKNLGIINYGKFEFTRDETTPKEFNKIKLPKYVVDILSESEDWKNAVDNNLIPLIKKYEKKLCYSEELKPKELKRTGSSSLELLNSLISLIKGKNELVLKKTDPSSNYNETNFWQVNNSLSNEVKDKVNSNINNNNKDDNDEEDELLNIAMNLEKKEKESKGPKIQNNSLANLKFLNNIKKDGNNNNNTPSNKISEPIPQKSEPLGEKDKEQENKEIKEENNEKKNEEINTTDK